MGDNPPFVMQDPPTHTDFRKLVSRGFTPRQVTAVEPKVREFVVERLERLKERGEGDIVVELFKPLPSMVVAHYLGVPEEDRSQFDGWTDHIVAAAAGGAIDIEAMQGEVAQTVGELMMYFSGLIERRRAEPEDDTVSHLVAAGVGADGDIAGTLQILGFAFTMLIDDRSLIPGAVEEFLRLTSPVQGLARTVTRDVTVGDTTIPAGRRALLLYGSANRDEREYGNDAGELDILRKPRNILTFSHGNHHCLGAAAARMQSRVALEELLTRIPDFEVDLDGIARAAGCSRATLYRYFENREALHIAYVHRAAGVITRQVTEHVAGIDDPTELLTEAMVTALRLVRADPTLSAWFRPGEYFGGSLGLHSEVINTMVASFIKRTATDSGTHTKAKWYVRVIVSLLAYPEDTGTLTAIVTRNTITTDPV
ncbi:Cytochrome P450 130 [Aduncisulcus paluster]|uniref:Cytochrome P450 130 n=1 Tax=Aduncisulcus paluster TaxID=2918883 RepID=A0ABQ5K6P7_9EUKA|nr:Cytochrome P450 130 [Aduncisulcus paluster]